MAGTPQSLADSVEVVECNEIDHRFIPLRAGDLLRALCEKGARAGYDVARCEVLLDRLERGVQALAAAWQRDLEEFYGAFNPDRDTIALRPDSEFRTPEGYAD